jgi:hypothetical protein
MKNSQKQCFYSERNPIAIGNNVSNRNGGSIVIGNNVSTENGGSIVIRNIVSNQNGDPFRPVQTERMRMESPFGVGSSLHRVGSKTLALRQGWSLASKSGEAVSKASFRPCERSEAIHQSLLTNWIASVFDLAMTVKCAFDTPSPRGYNSRTIRISSFLKIKIT